jgi:predicted nucleic acid-binding protein
MRWKLRAADAVYVWLAARENAPLCTLDRELVTRAGAACEVIEP